MAEYNCTECSSTFLADELPPRGEICFKCHIGGIRLGLTYGKDDFHGPTVKERADQIVKMGRAAGNDPVPVGKRWV